MEVDTESLADGLTSVVSGYSSLPSGIETPEVLDLRKAKAGGGLLLKAEPKPLLNQLHLLSNCLLLKRITWSLQNQTAAAWRLAASLSLMQPTMLFCALGRPKVVIEW